MFLTTIVLLLLSLIVYYKWAFQYWRRKNLPYLKPSIPFGNCFEVLTGKENLAVTTRRLYNRMKQNGWKHGGIYVFSSPNYLPVHLDYIKNVLVTDFQHFTERGYWTKKDVISGNILNSGGEYWKNLKPKLTPCFTSSKIKRIFENLGKCHNDLVKKVEEMEGEVMDIKNICSCYTMDIIAAFIFGIKLHSFQKESSMKIYSLKLTKRTLLERLKGILITNFPELAKKLNVNLIPKDVSKFFLSTVKEMVELRKQQRRNDLLQLLVDDNSMSAEQMAAQCFALTIGGLETSAITMTFALYEIAKNPKIQEKLRSEIDAVLENHNGEISYDSIQKMSYLSQVVDETVRMYPAIPVVSRRCVKDYKVSGEDTVIEKGTVVIIPIFAVHYDEDYYPDPEKFDPERFTEENKRLRPRFAYLGFGGGPRSCIGMQFGLVEVKMGLSYLIRNFEFFFTEKTCGTVELEPNNYTFAAVGGIWLKAKKINKN